MAAADLKSGASEAAPFRGWEMVARGLVCQNVASGFAFGSFGVTLLSVQSQFHASRATATLGLSLIVLVLYLLSPTVAWALNRFGPRKTILTGVTISALGYLTLAFVSDIWLYLASCALLIGGGFSLFGPFPCSVLVSNWFVDKVGRAIGIVNMAPMIAIVPILAALVLEQFGLKVLFLTMAAIHLPVFLVAAGIVDRPDLIGQTPLGGQAGAAPKRAGPVKGQISAVLQSPIFWCLTASAGLLNAFSVLGSSQLVAIGVESGLRASLAVALLSILGVANTTGSLVVGALTDKIGASNALTVCALALAAGWAVIATAQIYPLLVVGVVMIGLSGGGAFPASNVYAYQTFGLQTGAQALAAFRVASLPLVFGLPPFAAALREQYGSYGVVMNIAILSGLTAAALFAGMGTLGKKKTA